MTTLSNAVRIEQLKAIASYIDQGAGHGTFIFFEGTVPNNTGDAVDNTKKLVTLNLPKPSLDAVNTGNITLKATDTATIIKSGTATFARLYNASGVVVADFMVGSDITLTTADLVQGGTLNISGITLSPSN